MLNREFKISEYGGLYSTKDNVINEINCESCSELYSEGEE